jgi:phosphate-selective porin
MFELAFRASFFDLTGSDMIGGREKNLSVGRNGYLSQKFRLMTNLIKVPGVDRPGGECDDKDLSIFSMRAERLLD